MRTHARMHKHMHVHARMLVFVETTQQHHVLLLWQQNQMDTQLQTE